MADIKPTVNPLYRLWLAFRATLFWIVFMPMTVLFAIIISLMRFAPFVVRMGAVKLWIEIILFWLRVTCGLGFRIDGLDNMPKDQGMIVMSKHSSTWETIALQKFFPPMVWVVKRELTWIPFFGWALLSMEAIAINRGTGRKAIKQLIEDGRMRMQQGRIVMMFPEGTRVLPGQHKPFKVGGAILAAKTGYPILPIAHNAGEFWPRHSWIKWPGTIRVVVGKPIEPADKSAEQIIREVDEWVTSTGAQISDHEQLKRLGLEK